MTQKSFYQVAGCGKVHLLSGRIFCVYSADNDAADERPTNYSVCAYSDNGGDNYKFAFYAYHDNEVRNE